MTEAEVEIILQRAPEQFPEATPRIISDNGPQFMARDFQRVHPALRHDALRTSLFYPQSNGKIERWHQRPRYVCLRKIRWSSESGPAPVVARASAANPSTSGSSYSRTA
jgi:transposase InsO family protein